MKGMRGVCTAGKHVTIDKSMIKYMGRAITYAQYMPAKPIKYGIKVFAVCCAFYTTRFQSQRWPGGGFR